MKQRTMKKTYMISRIFLVIITFVLFNIMFINEDVSWEILPPIFAFIVLGISYPSAIISRRFINFGDKLESKILKLLYFIVLLPIILFLLLGGLLGIMYLIFENFPMPNEFGMSLNQGFTFLFLAAIIALSIIVPYIQTLIVLIVKHFVKD